MSLVIRYQIGDVQDSQGVSASKMTEAYIVSSGTLNSTHSSSGQHQGWTTKYSKLMRWLCEKKSTDPW